MDTHHEHSDYLDALESFILQNKIFLEKDYFGGVGSDEPMDDPDYVEFCKEAFQNCLHGEEAKSQYAPN